jgi:hypothetical protein
VRSLSKRQMLELALCLAVMMHLFLFLAVRSPGPASLPGVLVPPETHYMGSPSDRSTFSGVDARTVWSPVMFSFPSELGFSRELLEDDLRTRLTFSKANASENFLEVDVVSGEGDVQIDPQELMITKSVSSYQLTPETFTPLQERPSANRIYVAPELKDRLIGGVVLPPVLNKVPAEAWEVHADVSISKQGQVKHVLLEQPLESAGLNQDVIRLLYGLHFQSAEQPVEGRIDIYSPRTDSTLGVEQ